MIKLKDLYTEIKRDQKRAIKEGLKQATTYSLNVITIDNIINSNGMPAAQASALKEFFKYYNKGVVPILNENTIKCINKRILTLTESTYLSEGFVSWIKSVGQKGIDLIKSGWSGIKQVWKNFKDIIVKVIDIVKEGLKKLAAATWEKVKGLWNKMKASFDKNSDKAAEHLKKHTPGDIKKEWNGVNESVGHLAKYSKSFISGEMWAAKVESGDVKPVSDAVDENTIFETLKFDKSLVEDLLKVNLLTEIHFEQLINQKKYPNLFNVVKYACKAIGWALNPINTALSTLAKIIVGGWDEDGTKGILYFIHKTAEKLGGTSAIGYPILGILCMELTEVALSSLNLSSHGKMLGAVNVGIEMIDTLGINIWDSLHHFIEKIPILGTAVTIAEWICIIYAIGNFVINVFPSIAEKINPDLKLAH
jgi:hypothetical protein